MNTTVDKSEAKLNTVISILGTVIFVVDLLFPIGVAIPMAYLGLVLLSLWSSNSKATVLIAVAASVLTLIGFFGSPSGGPWWMAVANRSLTIGMLWTTAALVLLHKRAEMEIRTLQGMLAVCASCRKVRDDHGFWTAMEQYLEEHSQLLFTHSLCPTCVEKWNPELNPSLVAHSEDSGPV